jgi:hypothetical protein
MKRVIERRGILRGLAASALAAPLAQLFAPHRSRAAAAAATVPPKVVFFYTPCGVQLPLWHPTQTGKTFTLPRLSAPLAPYQSECIFMDGVSMYPLNDHQGGSQQLLAGDDKDVVTLDLQLGELLKAATPFSSLQLGIQSRISKGGTPTVPHPHFSRKSLKEEIFAEDNPLAAFARVFGGASTGTAGSAMADAARLAMQRKSILDAANADLVSLSASLPGSEKAKIASYTDSLRALERRLSTQGVSASASCSDFSGFNPTHFAVPAVSDPNQASYNQTANRAVVADLQMEIARLALACGRTRVVTLIYEHTNAHNPIPDLGIFGVHDASHFNAPPGQLTGNATQEQKDAKLTAWENYRVWYAQKLAQFVSMLKATPDPAGGTLFDNTILFHGSELGDAGPHKADRVPFVFLGGGALGFKLGQSINFTNTVPAFSGGQHAGIRNLAHSTLLTLIATKMGLPLPGPQFGYSGAQALDYRGLDLVA